MSTFTSSKLNLLFTSCWTWKCLIVHSKVINSFFLYHLPNMSLNFRDTYFSRHFNFAIFKNRQIRNSGNKAYTFDVCHVTRSRPIENCISVGGTKVAVVISNSSLDIWRVFQNLWVLEFTATSNCQLTKWWEDPIRFVSHVKKILSGLWLVIRHFSTCENNCMTSTIASSKKGTISIQSVCYE